MPMFAPAGAVFDDPIGQGLLETDVASEFFRFDPFVPEDLIALGLEFFIQSRVAKQVISAGVVVILRHNGAGSAGQSKPTSLNRDDNPKKPAKNGGFVPLPSQSSSLNPDRCANPALSD